jgi:hypothetical protein
LTTVDEFTRQLDGHDSSVTPGADSSAASNPTTSIGVGPTSPKLSFVQRNSRDLTVDGKRWQFGGTTCRAEPFVLDEQPWFLPRYGQQTSGENRHPALIFPEERRTRKQAPFDCVVAASKARMRGRPHRRVNGGCDGDAEPERRSTVPDRLARVSTKAMPSVPRLHRCGRHALADEPAIVLWQLVNEAEALAPTCPATTLPARARAFADDVTGAIQSRRPKPSGQPGHHRRTSAA